MATTFSLARKFMVAAAAKGSLDEYMARGQIRHLFKNTEKEEFAPFDSFVRKHAALPSIDLLAEWWGENPPKATEPASYYFDRLVDRHFENVLVKAVNEANLLVQDDKSVEAAALVLSKLLPEMMRTHGNKLITIGEAYDLVMANYYQQMKQGDEYGVRLGYPVVDDYGGLIGGDVLSIVGRPAAGKSFLLLRGAHHVWKTQHKSPCFVSPEMNNLISGQRLVAMDAHIPLNGLKLQKGQGLSTLQLQKLQAAAKLAKSSKVPFHLMDGNLSTTVEDIYNYCRQLRPSVLFVDGAYLLKHPNPRLGRFERVAENCELLKQEVAGNLGIPVVASWQFSREASKKKPGGKVKPGLEDIGYSDAIGQISSIVLGLLDDDTVETMMRKVVTILKGRSGEAGEFQIHWQFKPTLNFDMYVEPQVEDLSFL